MYSVFGFTEFWYSGKYHKSFQKNVWIRLLRLIRFIPTMKTEHYTRHGIFYFFCTKKTQRIRGVFKGEVIKL